MVAPELVFSESTTLIRCPKEEGGSQFVVHLGNRDPRHCHARADLGLQVRDGDFADAGLKLSALHGGQVLDAVATVANDDHVAADLGVALVEVRGVDVDNVVAGWRGVPTHDANRSPIAESELLVTLGDCFQLGRSGPTRLILAAMARAAADVGLVEVAADAGWTEPATKAPTIATMAAQLVLLTSSLLSARNCTTAQK